MYVTDRKERDATTRPKNLKKTEAEKTDERRPCRHLRQPGDRGTHHGTGSERQRESTKQQEEAPVSDSRLLRQLTNQQRRVGGNRVKIIANLTKPSFREED